MWILVDLSNKVVIVLPVGQVQGRKGTMAVVSYYSDVPADIRTSRFLVVFEKLPIIKPMYTHSSN